MFDESLVTVWSAPNYCYRCGNSASIMRVDETGQTTFKVYDAAEENTTDQRNPALRRLVSAGLCHSGSCELNLSLFAAFCSSLFPPCSSSFRRCCTPGYQLPTNLQPELIISKHPVTSFRPDTSSLFVPLASIKFMHDDISAPLCLCLAYQPTKHMIRPCRKMSNTLRHQHRPALTSLYGSRPDRASTDGSYKEQMAFVAKAIVLLLSPDQLKPLQPAAEEPSSHRIMGQLSDDRPSSVGSSSTQTGLRSLGVLSDIPPLFHPKSCSVSPAEQSL
jgi:hypothetical protein